MRRKGSAEGFVLVVIGLLMVAGVIFLLAWGMPKYRIYRQDLRGQAELREAEWTKKISIEEARAKKESAQLLADAEEIRARGVANANKIIGTSLQGNEAYLRYLWIQNIQSGENSERIYIPTEANLPILEAK